MIPEAYAAFAFGLLALFLLLIGARRGFFRFPAVEWMVPLRLWQLIGAFAIYFLVTSVIATMTMTLLKRKILLNYLAYSNWLNFLLSSLILLLLAVYFFSLPKAVWKGILRRPFDRHPLREDVWNAFYSWILAFPLVLFISQMLELIIIHVFHIPQLPDQIAVKFLKSTFHHPTYFSLAVLSIVLLAPLIEETLFRGFLQTYIRRHLGSKQAIVITSFCFSLFHYSAGQGLGNISIILSLFILSLFLGFLYEKEGSLLAPMILHGSFNAVSVVNLYLFGGFATGL